jgi:hypothetical protein
MLLCFCVWGFCFVPAPKVGILFQLMDIAKAPASHLSEHGARVMDVVMDAASASAGMGDAPEVDEKSFQRLLNLSGTLVKQGEEMMLTGPSRKDLARCTYFIFAILVKVWVTFRDSNAASGRQ